MRLNKYKSWEPTNEGRLQIPHRSLSFTGGFGGSNSLSLTISLPLALSHSLRIFWKKQMSYSEEKGSTQPLWAGDGHFVKECLGMKDIANKSSFQ